MGTILVGLLTFSTLGSTGGSGKSFVGSTCSFFPFDLEFFNFFLLVDGEGDLLLLDF